MKRNWNITVIIMLSSFVLQSCGDDPDNPDCVPQACTSKSQSHIATVNGFDGNPLSDFYNKVVANFQFSQSSTDYTAPNYCSHCSPSESVTNLTISNATDKTITFDYSISYSMNAYHWNYQNVARIDPHASITINQISTNYGDISRGQIIIQSTNITYE
jgi:hypothetical protein